MPLGGIPKLSWLLIFWIIAWEFLENFTNSQINLSEAREHFFKNTKAHRAQKDISEALEQVHS